jgi:hypothetical protein
MVTGAGATFFVRPTISDFNAAPDPVDEYPALQEINRQIERYYAIADFFRGQSDISLRSLSNENDYVVITVPQVRPCLTK